jgi:hypothetical protein
MLNEALDGLMASVGILCLHLVLVTLTSDGSPVVDFERVALPEAIAQEQHEANGASFVSMRVQSADGRRWKAQE